MPNDGIPEDGRGSYRDLAAVRLCQDSGCVYGLLWRVAIDRLPEFHAVREGLRDHGWRSDFELGDLRAYVNGDGHQLLLLERTWRIQVRLSYLTPRERRPDVARAIFEALPRPPRRSS